MLFIVTLISFLVHIYSLDYMGHDPHIIRFLSYLSFFTFFMLLLVTGDNFIVMFLGWEGVGLCSYLLINFWYTRTQANKAAIKAMVVNRVGDLGFALGILGVFFVFKSVNFSVIFGLVPLFLISDFYFLFSIDPFFCMFDFFLVICLLLFIGAVGKSAQLGLHT
jgi:NADH:ubiquinone oxidoreductase subunit 5 (subunit L)/multisubunit Na+/H+ antiporter MnhA subunit